LSTTFRCCFDGQSFVEEDLGSMYETPACDVCKGVVCNTHYLQMEAVFLLELGLPQFRLCPHCIAMQSYITTLFTLLGEFRMDSFRVIKEWRTAARALQQQEGRLEQD